jgi:hypothetical protein
MTKLDFSDWFFSEASKLPLAQVDKTCQTTCASATVVWLIKLVKNWEKFFDPAIADDVAKYVESHGGSNYIEGLQVNIQDFKFRSIRLGKNTLIIPQEDEVRGISSEGVKPISGSITIRPKKPVLSDEHGYYVGLESAIKIPFHAISSIKAVGGCALTCLHMSGGQVYAKTVGGYKKTYMYKNAPDLFYNNTLEQYFKAAIKALYNHCRKNSEIDHYAIRLNGTTDIKHYANLFALDMNVINRINKYLKFFNNQSLKSKRPINFKMVSASITGDDNKVLFFDIFNNLWKQAINGIKCKFNPTFLHFYDYTALSGLMNNFSDRKLPDNYHITFSVKEGNLKEVLQALSKGMGVALAIWNGTWAKAVDYPFYWYPLGFGKGKGYRIINGDSYDARFLDKKIHKIPENEGYVVGLRAKGKLEDTEDVDTGFAERMLLNYRTPSQEQLVMFGKKYPTLKINSPFFDVAKKEFLDISNSYMNPRFDPNDPAVNKIILEQIIYALRRNGIKINGMDKLASKQYYDELESMGVKSLVNLKDVDYDRLHGFTMAGTSAKTDKGDIPMTGTSAKVEKSSKYKVKTNQMNMLPHMTFAALKNKLDALKLRKLGG